MIFARKVWKLLVALKDGLALLFLLVFFLALYAALTARPYVASVQPGALVLDLNGVIVEETSEIDPLSLLLASEAPLREYRSRDLVRALRLAADDDRVKAVVLDLSGFVGGGFVHLQDIGDALDMVRAAKKPVLTYATAYIDDGIFLAAHSTEAWVDPMGGAFVTGPGGNNLYFGRLLEKLKITANVYRVGTFKSAVEPYILNEPSDAARQAYEALYGAVWEEWKADVTKARPGARIDTIATNPVGWFAAANGDAAEAALSAGLIDRIGSKTEFGARVAELVGKSPSSTALGSYASTDFDTWLGAHPIDKPGRPVGVITIAGEIVDGDAGPGVAGGDRITRLLDEAAHRNFAALVVRVDSPGGSIVASEQIRRAIQRYKDAGVPVVVSMGNMAASGGYWVSTPASRIFAEPGTITGSIGVFAILPTFDRALADFGVTGAGVKTTPLSGQPDVVFGLAPEVSAMLQANVENSYGEFVGLVSRSRGKSPEAVDAFAQGRPWAGGAARQLGLVDQFGSLDDALAYAAGLADLEAGSWHPEFLGGGENAFGQIMRSMTRRSQGDRNLDLAAIAAQRQSLMIERALHQAEWLLAGRGAQALCLECPYQPGDYSRSDKDAAANLAKIKSLLGFLAD